LLGSQDNSYFSKNAEMGGRKMCGEAVSIQFSSFVIGFVEDVFFSGVEGGGVACIGKEQ